MRTAEQKKRTRMKSALHPALVVGTSVHDVGNEFDFIPTCTMSWIVSRIRQLGHTCSSPGSSYLGLYKLQKKSGRRARLPSCRQIWT
jgi:hypothetical protein